MLLTFLQGLPGQSLVNLPVFLGRLLHNFRRQLRARWLPVPTALDQPVPDELLVEAGLRTARLVLVCRPEAAAIRREQLVYQNYFAVQKAELHLRVGDDNSPAAGVGVGIPVDLQASLAKLVSQGLSHSTRHILEADINIMPLSRLGGRSEDGLGQVLALHEP